MSFTLNGVRENRSVPELVVAAVADAEGVEPTDLDPLYATLDPDALDGLFKSGVDGRVAFAYEGYDVVVSADGAVTLDGDVVEVSRFDPVAAEDDGGASATGR